jgi:CubicO group peptidase (beta-lactamase class C family)
MHKALLLLSFHFVFISCHAQIKNAGNNDLANFIQQKGDSLYKAGKLPGIFVGVLNKGTKEYFNFGYSVPDEKIPFDAQTLFEAGSITKTLTAYVVESILLEKRIADSTSIISYLPDSVQKNNALASITFRSLLNHTSGLPRLPENMKLSNDDRAPYDHYTEQDLYSYLKTVQPKRDGKSNYSNLGMGLAGVLAQRISGKDYPALLQEYIFTPFGINNKEQTNTKKSQGYFNGEKAAFWQMNVLAPAGGLQTAADNMLNYLSKISRPTDARAKAIIERLLVPTATLSPVVRIGKAWHTLEQKNKPAIYWHNGGTYGFSTFAAFVKDTEQAVIVIVNQFNQNAVSDGLGIAIMRKMLE